MSGPGEVQGVGQRIRDARRKANLSQPELAQRSGLHQSLISKWERGEKKPNLETIARLAVALEVPVEVLVTGAVVTAAKEESSEEAERRRAIDAARRFTERLTMEWRRGHFSSLEELAEFARGVANGFPAPGVGFVEGWIQLFLDQRNADESEESVIRATSRHEAR